ncbi:pyrimidine 5'-nucleotidase [Shewanella sp. 10N.286.48.B5]|uniref:pyrimidine 5'-nucleotidase n=1 Tax=Shewanella sp. 10N.286.48.B5 TaxID=1880834 RepID=UPI000C863816|nr:pyrimidine 5'-nucleotidase [Shewanella sp. 10N.286.48.B5]PMH85478.1 noncanonical pyrimidine nucleotidase, YjjG family [Shewanella sp. 10N.286.48.B5]
MKYQWILFDADETLFDFDIFSGLKLMFSRFDIDFKASDFEFYQSVNKQLWLDYQQGLIDAAQLQHTRFLHWAEKLNVTTKQLNSDFLAAMADICQPLPGAKQLVDSLKGKANLGIITNGLTELQNVRLERTGFKSSFEHVVISEEFGKAKPDLSIFEHTFALMGNPDKQNILMVGDNLHSDILGGVNAGIDTCWLNHHGKKTVDGITPTFEVKDLQQLHDVLHSVN